MCTQAFPYTCMWQRAGWVGFFRSTNQPGARANYNSSDNCEVFFQIHSSTVQESRKWALVGVSPKSLHCSGHSGHNFEIWNQDPFLSRLRGHRPHRWHEGYISSYKGPHTKHYSCTFPLLLHYGWWVRLRGKERELLSLLTDLYASR
jgi:hypothetical protein